MAVDLAAVVERHQEREARRADLAARDAENGGMRSIADLVAEQQKREAARDWRSYRPSVTAAEVTAAKQRREIPDMERITVDRLMADCRAALRRFSRLHRYGGARRPETVADVISTDAALLVLDWPLYGGGRFQHRGEQRSAVIDLGGSGQLPPRAVWLKRDDAATRADRRWRLTDEAWSVLLAAIKTAARSREVAAMAAAEAAEIETDPLDIAAAVEQEQREAGAATRLPDLEAPEVISRALALPLDAARSIVAAAYPAASRADLAASWGVSEASLKVALSRGAATVRKRYPQSADLLEALDSAAASYHRETLTTAALALLDWRAEAASYRRARDLAASEPTAARRALAWIDLAAALLPALERAERAAADWRAITGELPQERRALYLAALSRGQRAAGIARTLQRSGALASWQSIDPERVALAVARLLPAERRRARQSAALGARGSHLSGSTLQSAHPLDNRGQRGARADQVARAQVTPYARRWSAGLEAATERERRALAARRGEISYRAERRG